MTRLDQNLEAVASGGAASGKRPGLPLLTSLRFFAALDVLVYHRAPRLAPGFLANLAGSGYEAVSFFFILSGFILVYVYDSPAAASRMTSSRRAFWWARFSRIMPGYVLGLLISAPIFVYSGLVSRISPLDQCLTGLVLLPLLLQAWWPPVAIVWNGPAWSLSAEAFFYACFPWLIRTVGAWSARQGVVVAVILLAVAEAARYSAVAMGPPSVFRTHLCLYWPIFHLPHFILGMTLGRWFLDAHLYGRTGYRWLFPFGVAAAILLFGCRSWLPWWALSGPAQAIVFAALIVGAGAARQTGVLASPICVLLGEASYAMYILHEPLVFWWERFVGGIGEKRTWLAFSAFAATVVIGAVGAYLWIETPLRRWLLRHPPGIANRASAYAG